MKKGDLIAKCWIITDLELALIRSFQEQRAKLRDSPPLSAKAIEMHEPLLILYSQNLYGG
jgi:hypothetical protein